MIDTKMRGYCMFWKLVLRLRGGRGHEVMLVEWGIFGLSEWFAITSGSVETATLCCWLNSKMLLEL